MKNIFVLLLISGLVFVFCARRTSTINEPLPTDHSKDTTTGADSNKYTRVDSMGHIDTNYVDTADWSGGCGSAIAYLPLFGFPKSLKTNADTICNDVYPVFPNPCSTTAYLIYVLEHPYRVLITLSKSGQIIDTARNQVDTATCVRLKIAKSNLSGFIYLRIFYYDTLNDSLVFQSAGDILFE